MEPVTVAQKAPAPFASTRTSIEEILSPSKSLCLPVDTDYLLGRVKNVLAPWLVVVDGHFFTTHPTSKFHPCFRSSFLELIVGEAGR
jgi:hypothetical protein